MAPTTRQIESAGAASQGDVSDTDHPLHAKFARLTAQEERNRLLDNPSVIGTREGLSARLAERGCTQGAPAGEE